MVVVDKDLEVQGTILDKIILGSVRVAINVEGGVFDSNLSSNVGVVLLLFFSGSLLLLYLYSRGRRGNRGDNSLSTAGGIDSSADDDFSD